MTTLMSPDLILDQNKAPRLTDRPFVGEVGEPPIDTLGIFDRQIRVFNRDPTGNLEQWLRENRCCILKEVDLVNSKYLSNQTDILTALIHKVPYPMLLAFLAFTCIHCCTYPGLSLGDHSPSPSFEKQLETWNESGLLSNLSDHLSISNYLFQCLERCKKSCVQHTFVTADELDRLLSIDIKGIPIQLWVMAQDAPTYDTLISQKAEKAQGLLDPLQALLDYSGLDPQMIPLLVKTISKLSKVSALYPRSLVLQGLHIPEKNIIDGGGYGDIYKGHVHGDPVAVKALRIFGNPEDVLRRNKVFVQEAVICRQISHPNLLPFLGIHNLDSRICLVSPWLENGNIMNFLKSAPDADHTKLVLDLAFGIEYLHNFTPAIVHGNIKGANVLVTSLGQACLADFGHSVIGDFQGLSSDSSHAGSLRWQAPELFNIGPDNVAKGPSSDMYAFACTCYEIFVGKSPFYELKYDAGVMWAILHEKRTFRPSDCPHLNDVMWDLIQCCWTQDPSERPTSGEIVKRLQRP